MAVKIGHASISEKGSVNGTKGDQTAREVYIRDWYSKPWDYMAIHPDAKVRERHAKAVEAGCANNNIGYGQGDRNTLNTEAKKVGYDLSKIKTKCNTDCSEFMNVCAVASGAPGVTHAANGWTTVTMQAPLKKAGYKIITAKAYLQSADYCVRGAIYVKAGSHTVCGLTNGTKAEKTLAAAGLSKKSAGSISPAGGAKYYKKYAGTSPSLVDALSSIGVNTIFSMREKIAKANGIKNYTGTASQNTKLMNLLMKGKLKKP